MALGQNIEKKLCYSNIFYGQNIVFGLDNELDPASLPVEPNRTDLNVHFLVKFYAVYKEGETALLSVTWCNKITRQEPWLRILLLS